MRLDTVPTVIDLVSRFYDRQIAQGAIRALPGRADLAVEAA
jgi:hypothetical protein